MLEVNAELNDELFKDNVRWEFQHYCSTGQKEKARQVILQMMAAEQEALVKKLSAEFNRYFDGYQI